MSIIDNHQYVLFVHLFSVIIAGGSSLILDLIFMNILKKDGKISAENAKVFKIGGNVIIVFLVLLLVSGFFLFSINPQEYKTAPVFAAKMTFVVLILANAALIALHHIPAIQSGKWRNRLTFMVFSGSISAVGWPLVVFSGVMLQQGIQFQYTSLLSAFGVLYVAIFCASMVIARSIDIKPITISKNQI